MANVVAAPQVQAFSAAMVRGIVRALNRTATSTRAVMARGMAGYITVKVGAVKDRIRVREAQEVNDFQYRARLTVRDPHGIPLIRFRARGPFPSRGRGRGVTAKLPGGSVTYPHGFIAVVGKGRHRGAFARKPGASRRGPKPHRSQLPIVELRGPSYPDLFALGLDAGEQHALQELRKQLASQTAFALSQRT